jgi:hypothetical protein
MPSCSIVLSTGAVYNLLSVIRGTQTVGVTIDHLRPGQVPNVNRLVVQADPDNGALVVAYGDGGIATDGSTGKRLLAGDSDVLQAYPVIGLPATFLAVSASGTKVNLQWE